MGEGFINRFLDKISGPSNVKLLKSLENPNLNDATFDKLRKTYGVEKIKKYINTAIENLEDSLKKIEANRVAGEQALVENHPNSTPGERQEAIMNRDPLYSLAMQPNSDPTYTHNDLPNQVAQLEDQIATLKGYLEKI